MLKRWLLYLLILAGCFVFYVCYQEWFSYLTLMAVLWLPIFSLVISLPVMFTARMQKNVPAVVTRGMRVVINIRPKSVFPLPPWKMKLRITRPMTRERFVLRPGYLLPTEHCAQLQCRCGRPVIYDYLGLFGLPMGKLPPFTISVRPARVETEAALRNPQNILRWKPKRGGGFSENHELRLYRPGDSIQHIHWKASGKTGKLILREPMEPANPPVLRIALDGDPDQIDNKLGKLQFLGQQYLQNSILFVVHAETGNGPVRRQVSTAPDLLRVIDEILACPPILPNAGGDRK